MSLLLPSNVDEILNRVDELRDLNEPHLRMRQITRAVMNGGAEAVSYMIADSEMEHLPSANLMHSAIERAAQKLGKPPQVRVDAPSTRDSARSRNSAEKRERIVEAYDRAVRLDMQMPQAARWMLGYGFCVWVIESGMTHDNQPFPSLQLRDPYGCLPGPWTVHQQPEDMAFIRRVPETYLRKLYPNLPRNLRAPRYSIGGVQILDQTYSGLWENQEQASMMRVIEYRNKNGVYMVLEDAQILLDFEPVPEGVDMPYVVAKRFAFDQLIGQYEHIVGLQQLMTRMNVLAFLSVQDAVFAETNVYGELQSDEYRRGRGAVNVFSPGTRVERPTDGNVFPQFQQIDRLERQLRMTGAYPVTDDSQSPNSYVTGAGLQELTQGSDAVVQEYQTVFKNALEMADTKRLMWDEKMYGNLDRALPGYHRGSPYVESYRPDRHIKGNHMTRRMYGLLSGLDSSSKLVGLLQIAQAGWMDNITAMENLDGIDNIQLVRERMERQKAENLLEQAMLAMAQGQPPDPRLMQVLIEQLEPGPVRNKYEEVFFPEPEEPEIDPATGQPVGGVPGEEPMPGNTDPLSAQDDAPQAILSRLFASGGANATARTIQR